MMKDIEAKDIIAGITILGGFTLMAMGINGVVGGILIGVTAYYFRKRIE